MFTDHSTCTPLLSSTNPSPKMTRWALTIPEHDLDIMHRSGKSNRVANALSRNPLPVFSVLQFGPAVNAVQSGVTEPQVHPGQCESDIGMLQRADEDLLPIFEYRYLESDVLPSKLEDLIALERSNFEVIEGVLYFENPAAPDCWHIAVPKNLRSTLLKESHGGKFAGILQRERSLRPCGPGIGGKRCVVM